MFFTSERAMSRSFLSTRFSTEYKKGRERKKRSNTAYNPHRKGWVDLAGIRRPIRMIDLSTLSRVYSRSLVHLPPLPPPPENGRRKIGTHFRVDKESRP